mmetsp:Transcript_20238/g.19176  ORF Transcript_20238/g.19176 Transcript_20238/m.19176 type:complete len:87 (-) Transcript_20238:1660-1920(-)
MAVQMIFNVFIFGLFVYCLLCVIKREYSWHCLISNVWTLFVCGGFSFISVVSVLNFLDLYQEDEFYEGNATDIVDKLNDDTYTNET